LAGQRLGGLHVDRIDIGTFLAVHLDRHEVIIDHGRGLLIFEGLMRHHMAPMARRVPHREEHRHLTFGCLVKSIIRPLPPVHRILGMLEQVRAGRRSEAVAASHALRGRPQLD
jgi:hypothetical protein